MGGKVGTKTPQKISRNTRPDLDTPPAPLPEPQNSRLRAVNVQLTYGREEILRDLNLDIPDGKITVIVGPNGCGKSTLLRALSRLLRPQSGQVLLDGKILHQQPTREVAMRLGLLPQTMPLPTGITVENLVQYGRYPHEGLFHWRTNDDDVAVENALSRTGLQQFRHRHVDTLSGGQRQRAWIALAFAQETPIMLLDEPTNHLDLAQRQEVLDLLTDLNQREGRTIVLVLHELNSACRYANWFVAMKEGRVVAQGPPHTIVTEPLIEKIFGVPVRVFTDPVTHTPICVPIPPRTIPKPADPFCLPTLQQVAKDTREHSATAGPHAKEVAPPASPLPHRRKQPEITSIEKLR